MKQWYSRHGFLKPNSWDDDSENGVLFSVEEMFLTEHAGEEYYYTNLLEAICNLHQKGFYITTPESKVDTFSLDNAVAVASFAKRFKLKSYRPVLRTLKISPYWYRFYDVVPYLLVCKYKSCFFFRPWISFVAIADFLISRNEDTSGKLLYYVKFRTLNMYFTNATCELIMKLKGTSFLKSFAKYFPEEDHVNNEKSRIIWGEQLNDR